MTRARSALALLLAAAVPLSGCATTHLGGEYRTKSTELASKADRRTVAKGSEWQFFWGLVDTGHVDVDEDLHRQLRANEVLTDIEIKDRLSVGGFLLWIVTAGIVSHHAIVVKGRPAVLRDDRAASAPAPTTPPRERETIVLPAQPTPAGHEEGSREDRDGVRSDER